MSSASLEETLPAAIIRGELGIRLDELDDDQREFLEQQLTLVSRPWGDNPPRTVRCYREEDGYLWIPRHFEPMSMWQLVEEWAWTTGRRYQFRVKATLDPERGQVKAVPAMIEYLKRHGAGVLCSGTGTGKTVSGLVIGAQFESFIGIPVYNGHMVDHWTEDAMKVLGLSEDDIGIVQSDRCDLGRPVTIMMIQSLLARRYPDELYEQIGFLIGDETPHFGAPEWKDTVGLFPARYRLGLTANPTRKDGLDQIINWTFGEVGYTAKRIRTGAVQAPTVTAIFWKKTYPWGSYCKWEKDSSGQWEMGDEGHPSKYDNVLAGDEDRTDMLVEEIKNAAVKQRSILVFSSRVDHLVEMREKLSRLLDPLTAIERLARLRAPPPNMPVTGHLKRGLKVNQRAWVLKADIIFATFAMARDAFDAPKLDTEFFGTPPGDPEQPAGRLREKAEGHDRKPLMIVEVYEDTPYGRDKWCKRRDWFRRRGFKVQEVTRVPPRGKGRK